MRPIKLTYEINTANNNWWRNHIIVTDGKEWERIVSVIHSEPDKYKIISVEHI